ncbi:hypothetical protein JKF63_07148 [Porcisia hertigi]|uniref:Uncharacterized protein n=1 Tax=Porcisia hertigi TaxID=2761500 RepID=A0A836LKL7_9TRYP|nr:hypothetical protein JKF63_07148 [Porcisia hertigi]
MAKVVSTYNAAEELASLSSTSVLAIDMLEEPSLDHVSGGNTAPLMATMPPSSSSTRLLSSRVAATGSEAPLLVATRSGQGRAITKHPPKHHHTTNEGQSLASDTGGAQEGSDTTGGNGLHSCTSTAAALTATRDDTLPRLAPNTDGAPPRQLHAPPDECPEPLAPSQEQQPQPKHLRVLFPHPSTPRRSPRQISNALVGDRVNFALKRSGATGATLAAASHAGGDPTPGLFYTSHWVQATLNGTAARSQANTGAACTSSRSSQPARLLRGKESAVAQAAAQLHEQRVAAVVQSQKEMRDFAVIMQHIEASGGANAVRQLQQRRRQHVRDAATAAAGASDTRKVVDNGGNGQRQTRRHHRHRRRHHREADGYVESRSLLQKSGGPRRTNSPHDSSSRSTSRPSGQLSLRGSARVGGGGGGRASMSSDGEEADETSSIEAFSKMSGLDDDDDAVAALSPHLRVGGEAGSMQLNRIRGHHPDASGLAAVAAPQTFTTASAGVVATENMSRLPLYRVREKTARGWVELHRRRVDLLHAGPPMLQRQVQESRQRLLRAYRGIASEERGADPHARTKLRGSIVAAAVSKDESDGVAGHSPGTPVHLKNSVDRDLTALTISWGGIPDGVQTDEVNTGSGGDDDGDSGGNYQTPLRTTDLAINKRRAGQSPEVDDKGGRSLGERVSASSSSVGGSGGSRCKDTDPSCVEADTPGVSIGPPQRRGSLLVPLLSLNSGTLIDVDAHELAPSTLHAADGDTVSLGQAKDHSMPFLIHNEEQYLRSELQRLLAEANECTLYGLHRSKKGCLSRQRGGRAAAAAAAAAAASTCLHSVGGEGESVPRSLPMATPPDCCLPGDKATPSARQLLAPLIPGQRGPVCVSSAKTTGGGSAVVARRSAADSGSPPLPPPAQGSPQWPRTQDGVRLGSDLANSISTLSAITPMSAAAAAAAGGALRSRSGMTQSVSPRASALGAPASGASVTGAALLQRPPRNRCNNSLLGSKRAPRRKPLPAEVGVGERAAALFEHEMLITRQWEVEADQAHSRDIECTCAMLQRLRPLREQLMDRSMGLGTERTRTGRCDAAATPGQLLPTHDSMPAGSSEVQPDTSSAVDTLSPNRLSNASARSSAVASMLPVQPLMLLDKEAESTITRSHVPQAVLSFHRQVIYDEAVRLDAAVRLEARIAYIKVLTRLAHKSVSSVSWPAVSALLDEACDRLQREVHQAMGASAPIGADAARGLTVQRATVARGSAGLCSTPPTTSSPFPSPVGLHTATQPPPPLPKSAQQPHGGVLQQLMATHLSVLELSQLAVQEVLQRLAALYRVPLSLLYGWIAEQQQQYSSRSYNYQERLHAIDRTIPGGMSAAKTAVQITLHCCRRPPLESVQKPGTVANREASGRASGTQQPQQQQQQWSGEEHNLYYIRVRSAVRSVVSSAVPLGSTGESPPSGSISLAPKGGDPAALGDGAKTSTMHSSPDRAKLSGTSPAKVLDFLLETLTVPLTSPGLSGAGRSHDEHRPSATKGALGYRSDVHSDKDTATEMSDSVLAVELMQVGVDTPLAVGKLRLSSFGFNPQRHNHGGINSGELRAHNVRITLRRRGYRSGELTVTLEI